ncbi:ABC transporter permease [Bacteroidota bacterium]
MQFSYFKQALRYLQKGKKEFLLRTFSCIISLFTVIVIIVWINYESGFDQFYNNYNNVYRLTVEHKSGEFNNHFARLFNTRHKKALQITDYPEVEEFLRVSPVRQASVKIGDELFLSDQAFRVDSNFFAVYNVPLLSGDFKTVLSNPGSAVIASSIAKKYFGDINPIGKSFEIKHRDNFNTEIYTVTGIFDDFPNQSHFHPGILISDEQNKIGINWAYVYILLKDKTDQELFDLKVKELFNPPQSANSEFKEIAHIQKVKEIHLNSSKDREMETNGSLRNIYILAIAALFTYLISLLVNINLQLATLKNRLKYFKTNKILGAKLSDYLKLTFSESLIQFVPVIISTLLLIIVLNPFIQQYYQFSIITEKSWLLRTLGQLLVLIIPFLIINFLVILTVVLKMNKSKKSLFRKSVSSSPAIFIIQYAISIVLIISSIVFINQNKYVNNTNLGGNKDNIALLLGIQDKSQYPLFKNKLESYSDIIDITASMEGPGDQLMDAFNYEYKTKADKENAKPINVFPVQPGFIDFYNLKLIAGEKFRPGGEETNKGKYILNKTALSYIGETNPDDVIGEYFNIIFQPGFFEPGEIIGVVDDFHLTSLEIPEKPLALMVIPIFCSCYSIKIDLNNKKNALNHIEEAWESTCPDQSYNLQFVSDRYNKLYSARIVEKNLILALAVISLIICLFGLYGISSINIWSKIKEIGIRKVLGATITQIVFKLNKLYLFWGFAALMIAFPLAYILNKKWLMWYHFKIEQQWYYFAIPGLAALIIVFCIVSIHSVRASAKRPADVLRHE